MHFGHFSLSNIFLKKIAFDNLEKYVFSLKRSAQQLKKIEETRPKLDLLQSVTL